MSSFKSSFLLSTFLTLTVEDHSSVIFVYVARFIQALNNVKIANSAAYMRSLSTIKGGVNYYENN